MEPTFIVTGNDIPPSEAVEGSIFQEASTGNLFRYQDGKWVAIKTEAEEAKE